MLKNKLFHFIVFINSHMLYFIVFIVGATFGGFLNSALTPTTIDLQQKGIYSTSTSITMEDDSMVIKIKNIDK